MVRRLPLALGIAWLALVGQSSHTDSGVGLPQSFFDLYDRAEYDRAVQAALTPDASRDFHAFRAEFERAAPDWINAHGQAQAGRRSLAVSAFVIEIAHAVYTSAQHAASVGPLQDPFVSGVGAQVHLAWQKELRPMAEWACELVRQRSVAPRLEREWFLASVQLFKEFDDPDVSVLGAHDVDPERGGVDAWTPGHLGHAVARFPEEPWFRVVAAERRTRDLAAFAVDGRDLSHVTRSDLHPQENGLAGAAADYRRAAQELRKFEAEPSVRAEVSLYLGTISLAFAQHDRAREYFDAVRPATSDSCMAYLADFMHARVDELDRHPGEAEAGYRSALTVVPRAQSASTPLAALLWLDGQATEATAIVDAALRVPETVDDPWTAFYSSHGCSQWSTFIQNLRAGLHP